MTRDRGSVTAETAVLLPSLVLLVLVAVWTVSLLASQVRVVEAAHTAARGLARGEAAGEVQRRVRDVLGPQARTEIRRGERVVATVRLYRRVPLPGPLARLLPGVTLEADATAVPEPGIAP
jgi:hypothetical protein